MVRGLHAPVSFMASQRLGSSWDAPGKSQTDPEASPRAEWCAPEPAQCRSRPVESNGFLSTTVAQWLLGARLLPDTCPELPQSGKRPHGTAAQARRMVKWPPGQASTHAGEVDPGAAGMCGACARVTGASGGHRPPRPALRPPAPRQRDPGKSTLPDGSPHVSTTQALAHTVVLRLEDFDAKRGENTKDMI